jgi:hypothetical protein
MKYGSEIVAYPSAPDGRRSIEPGPRTISPLAPLPYAPVTAGRYAGSANKRVPGPEIKDSGHGSGSPQRNY